MAGNNKSGALPHEPQNKLRSVVYTCTYYDYDVLLSPLRPTPNVAFVAFSDKAYRFTKIWKHHPIPPKIHHQPQNEVNRYCKLFPEQILPEYDLSIYVDGNILVLNDLTPLINEFIESGADIALFPGEHNRTVEEEIELTLKRNKVVTERREGALLQLAELRNKGLKDLPVTMNGVLFRRHNRAPLQKLMTEWWDDINRFAMRDQYSLPGLLAQSDVRVHHWQWQYFYKRNPYFHVHPHRYAKAHIWSDIVHTIKAKSGFSEPETAIWKILYTGAHWSKRLWPAKNK